MRYSFGKKNSGSNRHLGEDITVSTFSSKVKYSIRYPSGHYIRELGNIGDKESESEAILLQHDIPFHPFSNNVLQVCVLFATVLTHFSVSLNCLGNSQKS